MTETEKLSMIAVSLIAFLSTAILFAYMTIYWYEEIGGDRYNLFGLPGKVFVWLNLLLNSAGLVWMCRSLSDVVTGML
jgi:hypothetical protein